MVQGRVLEIFGNSSASMDEGSNLRAGPMVNGYRSNGEVAFTFESVSDTISEVNLPAKDGSDTPSPSVRSSPASLR